MRLFHLLAFVCLLFAASVCSQTTADTPIDTVGSLSGIEVRTSVDKADVYIGDLITYKIEIVFDSGVDLVPPPLGANLGAFDVKDYQADVITKLDGGRVQSTSTFVLSTFTTGEYIIPALPVLFSLADGSKKIVLTEALPIKVNSMLLNAEDSVDIKPLKTPYEFLRDWSKSLRWIVVGLLLLTVGGLFLWRWLRHRTHPDKPIDTRPAWEIAFADLASLQQKNLPSQGKYREYYFLLTDIARAYLGRIYGFSALDMTTEELLDHLSMIQLPGDLYQNLSRFAKGADLVKFATFEPETERMEGDFTFVHGMVESVRAEHLRKLAELAAKQAAEARKS